MDLGGQKMLLHETDELLSVFIVAQAGMLKIEKSNGDHNITCCKGE